MVRLAKKQLKGIHFYNPNTIKIIEKTYTDKQTGIYSARIEKLNTNTGKWIEKKEITTFFPDSWSIHRLFHECNFAYMNKKQFTEKIYLSKTLSGILVKFIVDEEKKIITFYPVIEN